MFRRTATVWCVVAAMTAGVALVSAQTAKLKTSWATPGAGPMSYAGKKVAAIAITSDLNVKMSAEEAMAQLSAEEEPWTRRDRAMPRVMQTGAPPGRAR